jgi:ribosomal protein S18 acetylase RimI-like enzyme
VFATGTIEFYLFSLFELLKPSLERQPIENIDDFQILFYRRGVVLSTLGAIAYSIALRQYKKSKKQEYKGQDEAFELSEDKHYDSEVRLQRRNILSMIGITVIQISLIFLCLRGSSLDLVEDVLMIRSLDGFRIGNVFNIQAVQILGVVSIILILILTIRHSIEETFIDDAELPSGPAISSGEKVEIEIRRAEREDVTSLRTLLMRNFGYVYTNLFGTNEKLTSRLLESILVANGGKHALGYNSFCIARPKDEREKVVGMLKLMSSTEKEGKFISTLSIIKVVWLNLGLRGLYRTWHNWRIIHRVYPTMKASELHIVYIAVTEGVRRRQVGKQLIEYAKGAAKDKGKDLVTLCVREKNVEAKAFLMSQGFSDEGRVPDESADNLLDMGAIIKMTARI